MSSSNPIIYLNFISENLSYRDVYVTISYFFLSVYDQNCRSHPLCKAQTLTVNKLQRIYDFTFTKYHTKFKCKAILKCQLTEICPSITWRTIAVVDIII